MPMGWKPVVRMEESATSASRPSFFLRYTSTRMINRRVRHRATATMPTYRATSSAPDAAVHREREKMSFKLTMYLHLINGVSIYNEYK